MAMAIAITSPMATATATARARARVTALATTASSDLQTLTLSVIALTASHKGCMSCVCVTIVTLWYGSLGNTTSSPDALSKPTIAPAPKPPEKRDGCYNFGELCVALWAMYTCKQFTVTIRVPSHITNGVIKARTKYTNVWDHNRQTHHGQIIYNSYVHANEHVADHLTKPRTNDTHKKFTMGMGLW